MSSFDPPLSRTTAAVLAVSAVVISAWLFVLWVRSSTVPASTAMIEVQP